jgi:hypothetical protein
MELVKNEEMTSLTPLRIHSGTSAKFVKGNASPRLYKCATYR